MASSFQSPLVPSLYDIALDLNGQSLFAPHSIDYVDLVASDLSRPRWENMPNLPTIEVWLVTGRGIANMIKETAKSSKQINELCPEANRECPSCNHVIKNSDVNNEWPGLPAGVKFDPSDLELANHLEDKVGMGNSKPHKFIDYFIHTLEEEQGICYTHPENLPGIKKDGNYAHFFHKISNVHASGNRKRRKINTEDSRSISVEHESSRQISLSTSWRKTGTTKPIIDNGNHKGWKKVMVLYRNAQKGCKSDKTNWVMHQYHLGKEVEEKDGQMVISKIFYQLGKERQKKNEDENIALHAATVSSSIPMPNGSQTQCKKETSHVELSVQNVELMDVQHQQQLTSPVVPLNNEGSSVWWEYEPPAVEEPDLNIADLSFERIEDGMMDPYYGRSDVGSPPDLDISPHISKIFCQLGKQKEDEADNIVLHTATVSPSIPMQNVELVDVQHQEQPTLTVVRQNNEGSSVWWEYELQAVEEPDLNVADHSFERIQDGMMDAYYGRSDLRCGNLSSPPDLDISELSFGSEDSISSWWLAN